MSPRAPHRFYFSGHLAPEGEPVALSPEESRHLLRVLRLRPGARIDLFDSGGLGWHAELFDELEGLARVRLLGPLDAGLPPEPRPAVQLAVAVVKRNPMDWAIEKLSELGVAAVQPLLTRRSIGQGDLKPYSDPPERWERLAIAAAKQCGRNRPLDLLPLAPLGDWLSRPRPPAQNFYAHGAPDAPRLGRVLAAGAGSPPIWIAIGPEGGWTPEELEAFAAAGFTAVRLGDLTLRTETAAIAAAAVCAMV